MSNIDKGNGSRFAFKIIVEPKGAGNYGFIHASGQAYTPKECMMLYEEMKQNILRHVDDVNDVSGVITDIYGEYEDCDIDWLSWQASINDWGEIKQHLSEKEPDYKYILETVKEYLEKGKDEERILCYLKEELGISNEYL